MERKYNTTTGEVGNWTYEMNKVNGIIDTNFPVNSCCKISIDSFLKDISSNMFIKNCPSMVCIIDFNTKEYLYVSESTKLEIDATRIELLEEGISRALLSFEENQKHIFLENILPTIFQIYSQYAAINEAKDIVAGYKTLLKNFKGEFEWYYHQISVIGCDESGFPRYGLKLLTKINDFTKDQNMSLKIHKKTDGNPLELIYSRDFLPHEIERSLSEREKEILKLVNDGYTTKMIADRLFISKNTVSTHRKNLLKKLKNNK